jgi:hypothetical protein
MTEAKSEGILPESIGKLRIPERNVAHHTFVKTARPKVPECGHEPFLAIAPCCVE